jgi:hypothetical protein
VVQAARLSRAGVAHRCGCSARETKRFVAPSSVSIEPVSMSYQPCRARCPCSSASRTEGERDENRYRDGADGIGNYAWCAIQVRGLAPGSSASSASRRSRAHLAGLRRRLRRPPRAACGYGRSLLFVEALAMEVGKVGSASAARVKLPCSASARKTFSSTSASFSNPRSVNGARFLELPDLLRQRRLRQMLDTKKQSSVFPPLRVLVRERSMSYSARSILIPSRRPARGTPKSDRC